ncbi:MAG: thioredoxin family protein [Bacteroidota bacterium]
MISQTDLDRAMSYNQYHHLLEDLLSHGKTTGPLQSEAYLNYAKLNLQRMVRLDKTLTLNLELITALQGVKSGYTWLVLTEGWCGDAAQNLPIMAAIEKECPNIHLRLLLRDENSGLMDQYLTGSSRSIPKLICVRTANLEEIFTWGPRPDEVQHLMLDLKAKGTPLDEKSLLIQKWYNTDKTQTLQKELAALIVQFLL